MSAPNQSDRVHLTPAQAEILLADGEMIHTFRNSHVGLLVGADWPRKAILEHIARHGCELSGEMATRMHHAMVLFDNLGPLFIETKRP